jgi:chitin disaccharide deacetylase
MPGLEREGGAGGRPPGLLVNADDFGLDPRISLAIARCAREGLIHSLSAVPFRDAFHAGLLRELIAECPGIRIGAHLTLVEFPYLTSGGPAAADGAPPRDFGAFLGPYLKGKVDAEWAYREWKAQIGLLASRLGRVPDHLDSHQHLHLLPGLWGAASRLQAEFGIPRLRVPYESLGRALFHRFPGGLAMQALARFRKRAAAPAFIGFFTSTRFTVEANRAALRKAGPAGRPCEVMVHPALGAAPVTADPAAGERPGIDVPFRTRIHPGQEREIAELARLRDFYR